MSETNELAERIARAVTAHMTEEQAGDVDLYDGYLTERLIPVITRQLATALSGSHCLLRRGIILTS